MPPSFAQVIELSLVDQNPAFMDSYALRLVHWPPTAYTMLSTLRPLPGRCLQVHVYLAVNVCVRMCARHIEARIDLHYHIRMYEDEEGIVRRGCLYCASCSPPRGWSPA